jgi:transposase
MPGAGPPYSPEFRAEAVRLLRSSGKTVAELSRELGVSEPTLRRWRLQAGDRAEAAGVTTDERSRLQELERGNRLRRDEQESPRGAARRLRRLGRATLSAFHEEEVRRRRFTLNHQGKDRSVRILARLTAEVIEASVAVVTLPAKWAANGLRWYADHENEPPGRPSDGKDGEGPVAAE